MANSYYLGLLLPSILNKMNLDSILKLISHQYVQVDLKFQILKIS